MMNDRVLAEYLKNGRELRQKYEEIKMGKTKRYKKREEKYQPIISPIQNYGSLLNAQTEILKDINGKVSSQEDNEKVGKIALEYLLNPRGQVDKLYSLLNRLYILYGEHIAGNSSPVIKNEIINILSEFKEL